MQTFNEKYWNLLPSVQPKKCIVTKCNTLHSLQMEAAHSAYHLSFWRGIFPLLSREKLRKQEKCCREE